MNKFKKTSDNARGFTLIELILVIAIIGLLSTIIFSGLDIAKNKAKDSALISSVKQLSTNLEQEYSTAKTYSALLGSGGSGQWIQTPADCDAAGFTGEYGVRMADICKSIMRQTVYPNDIGVMTGSLWIGPGHSDIDDPNPEAQHKFTIMVYLPGVKKFYCAGFDGLSSATEDGGGDLWTSPGCWMNY